MEKLFIRIPITDSAPVGPGKTQLLELVAETGSIRSAAIKMKLSYRRAWMLLAEMEKSFGAPVLARQTGGKRGGGAQLTPLGADIVKHFRAAERAAIKAIQPELVALNRLKKRGPV